jgi:hypothetical protein
MTSLRGRLLSTVAGQLGRPHGLLSPFVARALNRGNARAIAAAVDATGIGPGGVAADIGFGGGVGLQLLLDRAGDGGTVHGVEVSDDMLRRARSRFRRDVASGRLRRTGPRSAPGRTGSDRNRRSRRDGADAVHAPRIHDPSSGRNRCCAGEFGLSGGAAPNGREADAALPVRLSTGGVTHTILSKHLASTRRLIRQPSEVLTNSSSYHRPQNRI